RPTGIRSAKRLGLAAATALRIPTAADALADGRIDAVSLVLSGDSHYAHYRITRRELAGGPLGWLRRLSRPRTLRDALSPLSIPA
ncbi:hypothetical protein ACQCTC_10685, partial [Ralstonia pseudosolanacearum]